MFSQRTCSRGLPIGIFKNQKLLLPIEIHCIQYSFARSVKAFAAPPQMHLFGSTRTLCSPNTQGSLSVQLESKWWPFSFWCKHSHLIQVTWNIHISSIHLEHSHFEPLICLTIFNRHPRQSWTSSIVLSEIISLKSYHDLLNNQPLFSEMHHDALASGPSNKRKLT